ncbi:MAG: 6,7-dimethyl-8-ribityllumazine synthase [Rhodospirillaceae bacterium]|nr:6,7-dimethyl-8-ribityllumazine synthase [Rhodospirillaceae bacterium]|tara:strand:- start:156 stop:620 length:465 start_codon:yes stop_codon:yes gene_type:complete
MPHNAHIMLVVSKYYKEIAEELLAGSIVELKKSKSTWEIIEVPGAFEIPAAISMSINSNKKPEVNKSVDGYVALGCVIRGETSHYDYVCGETARGLQTIAIEHKVPIGFGVLTVDNKEQAEERAFVNRKNKGGEAARVCLKMFELKNNFGLSVR